jgi:superoxide dismutase, Fe-Mn family
MGYKLPPLGYAYDALEPYIDAQTMEIHHTKHHQTYVNNLNQALTAHPELKAHPLEKLLTMVQTNALPPAAVTPIRNNGGGHANHSFFWTIMQPAPNAKTEPVGKIAKAIDTKFDSFDKFKEHFDTAAKSVFGSGWTWLCVSQKSKELLLITTPNQDSPLMQELCPIVGLDVWEHAYYLKYHNKRPDYINAWWNVINWEVVEDYFEKANS